MSLFGTKCDGIKNAYVTLPASVGPDHANQGARRGGAGVLLRRVRSNGERCRIDAERVRNSEPVGGWSETNDRRQLLGADKVAV